MTLSVNNNSGFSPFYLSGHFSDLNNLLRMKCYIG
jgi:hypothetical protein